MTAAGCARALVMRQVLVAARKQPSYVRLGDLPRHVERIVATCEEPRIDAWRADLARGLTEEESLELYLNCVPLACDVFGLGDGAQALFGKRAAELTVNQAVLVAAIAPAPHLRRPTRTPVTCEMHRNEKLEQLVLRGVLAADEAVGIARRHTAETGLDPELVPERARPADAFEGKSAEGLVAYARAQVGAAYWWGTYGQVATVGLLNNRRLKYPEHYGSPIYLADFGKRVFDCSGLIKGYLWSDDARALPRFDHRTDLSAAMLYERAPERGGMDTFPRAHGSLLFAGAQGGITHVGIYSAEEGGCVYHAKGRPEGVVRVPFLPSLWSCWGTLPFAAT